MKPKKKIKTKIEKEINQKEINPCQLDREDIRPDEAGAQHTKAHEPYDFKRQDEMPNRDES